jgi:hypothetical protein
MRNTFSKRQRQFEKTETNMDESSGRRRFMRGEVKTDARAEELLALLKAEREVSESTEIPNMLIKPPLLPAIRQTSRHEESLCCEFPVTRMESRFLWKDWEETDGFKIENSTRRNSESFVMKQREYWGNPFENTAKNLPPLKARRRHSQHVVRPGCPVPPMTPCFDDSSN